MTDEMTDLVGIQVGFRWKVINIGVEGKISEYLGRRKVGIS